MHAIAQAQPNIALVKYWGKQDRPGNLPASGSLSLTLDSLWTRMAVTFDDALAADELSVNGAPATGMLKRVSACLDDLGGGSRPRARIQSECNFPIAAGLASSASAFAALVVAGSAALGRDLSALELARAAGRASGSAARSLYDGIVALVPAGDSIELESLAAPADWPLTVTVAVTQAGPKAVASGDAMNSSRDSSPFYAKWLDGQPADLAAAKAAVAGRDFAALAAVAEHNCLKMHSVMWTSRPALVYWNRATLACLDTVRALQRDGVPVFFTIDAGPQVKVVSPPEFATQIADALRATDGVIELMSSGLGAAARQIDAP